MTDVTKAPSVHVDANPFIYFVEGEDATAVCLKPFFELLKRRPGTAATSELTLAEVLPKAKSDTRRVYFELIIRSKLFQLLPVTREILIETADYRRSATRTLADGRGVMPKLPDAIHAVTAVQSRCRIILSADTGMVPPTGLMIFAPTEAGIARLMDDLA